ncbi:MAG: divergent PAP2 family protein [Kiritimatiellae bacterium]|nr:divergent PAP2 family protein [Kiritimatiellia bacterium]MBR1835909.1 divergent PAP2 family protein [Kiritimatiellia bacterium]
MHPFDESLFRNVPLWAAFFCWCTAQGLKIAIDVVRRGKLDLQRFSATGGMPSAHSATVCGLATSTGLCTGFDSAAFALAAVFALITMFDASTVRYAAGQQARILNEIIEELRKDRKIRPVKLKELLGHTRVEVLAGMTLGIALSAALTAWWTSPAA